MKHRSGAFFLIGILLWLLAQPTQSVAPPGVYSPQGANPYTGGSYRAAPPQNPFISTGRQQRHNPFTGSQSQPYRNPLTGQWISPPQQHNPLTGLGAPPPPQKGANWPMAKVPVTGRAGPGLEPFDRAVLALMDRHGIPGASLAIAVDGRLVYAKGFGWSNLSTGEPVAPTTLFGLASLSKPITAMAVLKLVELGRLRLDAPAFALLDHIKPIPGSRANPQLAKITVRQLLNHSGGWNREKSGDPVNWAPQVSRALRAPMPINAAQLISFMLGAPLDFEPGTENHYSNFGYIVLGEIVAKVSGQTYQRFVRNQVLEPMGIQVAATNGQGRKYLPGEAHRYLAGTTIMLPPLEMPWIRSAGGWSISPVNMARFLTALDGSRGKPFLTEKTREQMLALPPAPLKPRPNGTWFGLGWPTVVKKGKDHGYLHDGSWHGIRTFMKRSPQGVNWILTFNGSMSPDAADAKMVAASVQEVRQRVEQFQKYPDIDLFAVYR